MEDMVLAWSSLPPDEGNQTDDFKSYYHRVLLAGGLAQKHGEGPGMDNGKHIDCWKTAICHRKVQTTMSLG